MDAEAERQVLANPGSFDPEIVRSVDDLFVAVARDVPHGHLVALLDGLAAQFDIAQRGAAHIGQRGLPTDDLGYKGGDQAVIGAQLGLLIGVLAERQDRAGDRVAGGVIAADDQQDQVPQIFHAVHVFRGLAVGQHRDQVRARRGVDPLIPQPGEVLDAFKQLDATLLFGDFLVGGAEQARFRPGGGHVGPSGELAAVLPREVEKDRQGHGGQFDGDLVDPVELFADRQAVEDFAGPLTDDRLHLGEVVRRDHRADGLALDVMLGRVHGDEHRQREVFRRVGQDDGRIGGEILVVGVDRHDVVELRHRPIAADIFLRRYRPVNRVFLPQALEIGPHRIGAEQLRIGRIDVRQGHGIGRIARGPLQVDGAIIHAGYS